MRPAPLALLVLVACGGRDDRAGPAASGDDRASPALGATRASPDGPPAQLCGALDRAFARLGQCAAPADRPAVEDARRRLAAITAGDEVRCGAALRDLEAPPSCDLGLTPADRAAVARAAAIRTRIPRTGDAARDAQSERVEAARDRMCACAPHDEACARAATDAFDSAAGSGPGYRGAPGAVTAAAGQVADELTRCESHVRNAP